MDENDRFSHGTGGIITAEHTEYGVRSLELITFSNQKPSRDPIRWLLLAVVSA